MQRLVDGGDTAPGTPWRQVRRDEPLPRRATCWSAPTLIGLLRQELCRENFSYAHKGDARMPGHRGDLRPEIGPYDVHNLNTHVGHATERHDYT